MIERKWGGKVRLVFTTTIPFLPIYRPPLYKQSAADLVRTTAESDI